MRNKITFNQVKDKYFKTLELYIPLVARVHGPSHPEFIGVRSLMKTIISKTKDSKDKSNLDKEFTKLQEFTNYYEIPLNVCDTYASVYKIIKNLDKAYHN